MYVYIYTHIHTYIFIYMYIYVMSVGLASQFATQNCLSCYSKLKIGSKFHAEVATHFPHKIKNTVFIEYCIIMIATQLLKIATQFTI